MPSSDSESYENSSQSSSTGTSSERYQKETSVVTPAEPTLSTRFKQYFRDRPNLRRGLIALGIIIALAALAAGTGGVGLVVASAIAVSAKVAAAVAINAILASTIAGVGGPFAFAAITSVVFAVGFAGLFGTALFRIKTHPEAPTAGGAPKTAGKSLDRIMLENEAAPKGDKPTYSHTPSGGSQRQLTTPKDGSVSGTPSTVFYSNPNEAQARTNNSYSSPSRSYGSDSDSA